jgi:hypothetical protein
MAYFPARVSLIPLAIRSGWGIFSVSRGNDIGGGMSYPEMILIGVFRLFRAAFWIS